MKNSRIKKRPFALLEVMIAMALVALCALPLIFPHVAILKAEKAFNDDLELDHIVSLLYAHLLEKLYLNEIPWNDIMEGKMQPIESDLLESIGYNKKIRFKGFYCFHEIKHKPPKPEDGGVYLFALHFQFGESEKHPDLKYEYHVMMERVGS